jgi:Xaa-Pro aminopeptidase
MTQPDLGRLRAYRPERVRDQLGRHGYGACFFLDPINTRYATGTSNMRPSGRYGRREARRAGAHHHRGGVPRCSPPGLLD